MPCESAGRSPAKLLWDTGNAWWTCARHQAEAPAFTGAAKGGLGLLPFHRQAGAVTVENILQPHQTLRAGGEDGAVRAGRQFVNFAKRGKRVGGCQPDRAPRPGLHLHAAVNTEGWEFCGRRSTRRSRARRRTSLARRKSRTAPSGQRRGRCGARRRAGRRRPGKRTSSTCSLSGASACREWNSWCGRR